MYSPERRLWLALLFTGSLCAACTAGSKTLPAANRNGNSTSQTPFRVHVFNAQPSTSGTTGDRLIPASLSVEDNAMVLAERAGRIVKLSGREGLRIRKGEVIAQFADEDQQTQLRQAEIELNRLRVEEQQYEAQVKLRRSEFEREQALAREGVSSYVNVEQAQYRLEEADHE